MELTGANGSRLDALASAEFSASSEADAAGGRINLNPGTLGRPSRRVCAAIAAFGEERQAWPLGQYGRGREAIHAARQRATAIWGASPAITAGTTQTLNLLLLNLTVHLTQQAGRAGTEPLKVLTTGHEHEGGIAGFERHPRWSVRYLPEEALADPASVGEIARRERPALLLLSHVTWTGRRLPVEAIRAAVCGANPETWTVLDAAQSLGLAPLPESFSDKWDFTVASAHKWLSGPSGTGLLWRSARGRSAGQLCWNGHPLDPEAEQGGDEQAGGQDFSRLCGLEAALSLYAEAGIAAAQAQSARRADRLAAGLHRLLSAAGVRHEFAAPARPGVWSAEPVPLEGICTVRFPDRDPYPLYRALEAARVHVKCIKGRTPTGVDMQQLRFGTPWYEPESQIDAALARIGDSISGSIMGES